jgi:DNA-binding HxlR family transcriptional regulator
VRAGAHALSVLAVPLNVQVLQALEEEPTSLIDLRAAAGSPPQTTIRCTLRALAEMGLLERRRQGDISGSAEFGMAQPGRELLEVADVLQEWLTRSPQGPLVLGSPSAKSAVKALAEGWSTAIVRALSAKSLPLTELSKLISDLSYPSLERRLTAMRLAGQIERAPGSGRGTPYVVTDWLRLALAPLTAAARWERDHLPDQDVPVGRIDVEAAFLLAVPMLRLPQDLSGTCRLAVELRGGGGKIRFAGVQVGIEGGRMVSCVSRLEGKADGWATGPVAAWLWAASAGEPDRLEIAGDRRLVTKVLGSIHRAAFRRPSGPPRAPLQAVTSP